MSEEMLNARVKLQGFVLCSQSYRLQDFILERALAELNEAFLLPKRYTEEELKEKREETLKQAGVLKDDIPLPANLDGLRQDIKTLIGDIERFCEEQSVTPEDTAFSISTETGKEAVHWEFIGHSDHTAEELTHRMTLQPNISRDARQPNAVESDGAEFVPSHENGALLAGSPTDLLALRALSGMGNLEDGEGGLRYLSTEEVASQMESIFLTQTIQQEPNEAIRRLKEKYQPFLTGEQGDLQMVVSVLLAAVDMGSYIHYRDEDPEFGITYEAVRVLLHGELDEPPSNFIGEYLIATSDDYPDDGNDAMLGIGNLIHYFNELHALKTRGTALTPVTKNVLLWATYLAEVEKLVLGK